MVHDGINGFVDVEDVAKATILLMESKITEQRYIVNGDPGPLKNYRIQLQMGLAKKDLQNWQPHILMSIAWRIEKIKAFFTGKKPLLTKESARVAQSKTLFENDKLLKALPGFSFTPLEESIKNACTSIFQSIHSN